MAPTTTTEDGIDVDHPLADAVEYYGDDAPEGLEDTLEDAFDTLEDNLESNREYYAESMGTPEKTVEEVLELDNVRDVTFRNKDWQDPKITVWLRDCPTWANDASNEKNIRIDGRNDVHYVLDCRPF